MASSSNHQPSLKKIANAGNGEDRISTLPDSVLAHILSFLPTKYAVATSTLSPRWKHIWTSVPNLEFDEKTLLVEHPWSGIHKPKDHHRHVSFMNFIERVLLLHDLSSIQRFYLSCDPDIDKSRLNSWISAAVKRDVREIDINVCGLIILRLPSNLFICETLVVLKLGSRVHFDVPASISFPRLKIFHVSLIYPSNDLTQKLFSSCPVLEELSISALVGFGKTIYDISSPALKTLYISLSLISTQYRNSETVVMVDAPILECLHVADSCLVLYCLKSLSSLVKASVCVEAPFPYAFSAITQVNQLFGLLKVISNVKHLHLKGSTMAALSFANDKNWPVFPNLTQLELGVCHNFCCKSLFDLLNGAPNLCTMVFAKVPLHDGFAYSKQFNWFEPQEVPSCLRSSLKEIKISGIDASQDELNLIKYLLKNAEVLTKMTIRNVISSMEGENEFLKELVMAPRCSNTCQIERV
ncbi:hypothetical protein ACSBR2_037025 [Camellia fascicularis]